MRGFCFCFRSSSRTSSGVEMGAEKNTSAASVLTSDLSYHHFCTMNWLEIILQYLLKLCGIIRIEEPKQSTPEDGADCNCLDFEEPTPEEIATLPEEHEDDHDPDRGIGSRFFWIINPGHGPLTKGKHSPPLPEDKYVHYEFEYTHDIARRVCVGLEREHIAHARTVHLRPDLGNNLRERTDFANNIDTPLRRRYISIHTNSTAQAETPDGLRWVPDVEGTETFIYTKASAESKEMAEVFQSNIVRLLQSKDRGVKRANFHELRETTMPAILIEVGFHSNPYFVRLARTEAHRAAIAERIVGCILEYESFAV